MNEPLRPRQNPGLDLETLGQAMRQQRWTFLGFLAAVLLAALAGSLLAPRQYEAVALIELMPRAGQEVDVNAVVKYDDAGYMEQRDRARTQIQIILSRSVREEVLRRYKQAGYQDMSNDAEGLKALGRALSAGPREDTQLVEIRVLHEDPALAAVLANLVAEVYAESSLTLRTDAARETGVWLEGQIEEHRKALDDATQKVMDFKTTNDVVDIDEKVDGITSRMGSLQAALGEATTQRVLLQSKLAEHERQLAAGNFLVLANMFQSPTLDALSREHANVKTQSASTFARYGEQHPEYKIATEHLKRVEAQIAEEVQRSIQAERSQVQTLYRQESRINEELDKVEAELLEKQKLREQYNTLKLEEDRLRQLYGTLGARGAEVDLQARTRLNDVRIVDRALPPSSPAKPNVPLNMAMALVVGLSGGVGIALLRHRLDERIRTVEDVEQHLDAPLLGVIPQLPDEVPPDDRALYSFVHPRSQLSEALRAVRALLHTTAVSGTSQRLLITSCLQGEGKTDVAVGIAIALARLGTRVLLIDGDMRHPRLHDIFDVETAPGLADALKDPNDLPRFVHLTQIPSLHLLTCGTRGDDPTDPLSSVRLANLLSRLDTAFRVVIIDSPSAALVSDALTLARETDGVILVTRRGRVGRRLIAKTLARFRQIGVRVVGVVLNDVPPTRDTLLDTSVDEDYNATTARIDRPFA